MDLDLRRLRYFVTVAEQSSFRGAAERLLIAQPALSRQVRALENELGTTLLRRTPRGVELTAAGELVLEEARQLLDYSAALVRRVKTPRTDLARQFRIGFRPGIAVAALGRRFQAENPGLTVEVAVTSADCQSRVVRDGSVDVSLVRDVKADDLAVVPLYTEPQVVAIAADHPLVGQAHVRVDDLAGLALLQPSDDDSGPEAHIVERLEYVAAGRGILVAPWSVASAFSRPDVAKMHVGGIPDSQVAMAHSRFPRTAVLTEFTAVARSVLRAGRRGTDAVWASVDTRPALEIAKMIADPEEENESRTG